MAEAVVEAVMSSIIHACSRSITHAFNYRRELEELIRATQALADVRDRLEASVEDARGRGEVIGPAVQAWLQKASTGIEEANEFIEDLEQKGNSRCFVGLCPDLKTRYRHWRRAGSIASKLSALRNEGRFDQVSYRAAVRQMAATSNNKLGGLPSRLSKLSEIMDALKDPGINVIGLYGLAGVGKTALASEVLRIAIEDTMFDVVVMVTVTVQPNLRAMQEKIADFLGLKFDKDTEEGRATQIFRRLKVAGRVLMILDDVWQPLDLKAVGIPLEGVCKILLTSRNLNVLRDMHTQKPFRLEVLSPEETWTLFKVIAGIEVENPTLRPTAADIVSQCAGVPLLIVRAAISFKDEAVACYARLKTTYDDLPDEEMKSVFLLCGLHGKSNICIQDLLKYSWSLGLLKNMNTVDDVRNKLRTIIGYLKNNCLLLDSDSDGFVGMNDLFRDFATSTLSRSLRAFVIKSVDELKQGRDQNCTRIVLPDCDIRDLPEGLEFPELELLLLFSRHRSLKIPDSFFKGMEQLKVLNLTRVSFLPLPSSLHFLTNLHSLSLDKCILDDVGVIGELKKLEILSLSGSKIIAMPEKLRELSRLKLLDLSNCFKLKVIPKNVISSFSLLEELYVGDSLVQWEVEGNANLTELEHLSHLTTLEIRVLDAEMLPKTWFSNKLKRYRIYIGDDLHWNGTCETSKTLKFNCNKSTRLEHGVAMLKETEDLYLAEVEGIKNILPDLVREGEGFAESSPALPRLVSLSLYNLLDLEKFCNGQLPSGSFGQLRTIVVCNCSRLKHLFPLFLVRLLLQLQHMEVSDCIDMEEIVADKSEDDNEGIEEVKFAQLCSLKLHGLSQLITFFSAAKMASRVQTRPVHLIADQQSEGGVSESELDCPFDNPLSLFYEKVSFPNLEQLKLSSISCKKLWYYQHPGALTTLKSLVVEGCRNLKYLLTSQLAENLLHLKELEVCDCEFMETIIVFGDFSWREPYPKLSLPNLHTLKLKNLSNVTSFFNGYRVECPSLKKLSIERCPVLKGFVFSLPSVKMLFEENGRDFISEETLEMFEEDGRDFISEETFRMETYPLFDNKVFFPALEGMELSYIDCLECIWGSRLFRNSFYNLRTMKITQCKNLRTVFPDNDWDRFRRIENLCVSHCDLIEKIYELECFDVEKASGEAAFALTELYVSDLSSLVHIWTEDPAGSVTFENLFSVEVSNCKSLENIFPTFIARDLGQLEKLEISSCGVKEIVPRPLKCPKCSKCWVKEIVPRPYWPKLKCLKLSGCDKVIKYIWRKGEPPQYDVQQPLLEEVVPNLKELLLEPQALALMQNSNFLSELISKLEVLELQSLHFQSELPHSLFNHLKRLNSSATLVVNKSSLRAIFSNEGPDVDGHLKTLSHIKNLELRTLQEDVELELDFQYLEKLQVSYCDTLKIFAPSSASFLNLLSLKVWNCDGIKSFITSSMAKSMVNLGSMSIKDCRTVQDIIMDDTEHIEEEISFGKLEYLSLISLPGLTRFCSKNCRLRFPSLEKLTVELCPNLSTFSQGDLNMPMLDTVQLKEYSSEHIVCRDDDINAVIRQLFEQEVQNKLPKIAKASEIPEMEENWLRPPPFRRLRDLKILLVDKRASFYAVSTKQMQSLISLQVLVVENCDSIEEVFDLRGLNSDEGHTGLILQLDELHLLNLPHLRNVWNENPQGILCFRNLTLVKFHNCSSLKNIFTLPMALELGQLQYVEVKGCSSVEEIITKGEEEAGQGKTIFPSLCSVVLECLSSLKSFYSGSEVLQWSFLKKIDVIDCPRMETFASTFLSTVVAENKQMKGKGEFDVPVGPFSCGKVLVPSLQALRLDSNCIMKEIWNENFQADFLSILKVIELVRLPREYAQFPSNFFERSPNLEKLVLSDSSVEHLSLYERDLVEEEYLQSVAGLRKLKLSQLPNLEHLVGEDRHLVTICQYLETLELFECGRLKVLVPSSVSFHNLTILEVVKCNGLVNLLTAATARTLALLRRMTVTDCQMIQQIVEGDDVEDDITFSRLRTLELCGLPSLTCFCSGNHLFNFPSLDEMVVTECPKMDVEALTQ